MLGVVIRRGASSPAPVAAGQTPAGAATAAGRIVAPSAATAHAAAPVAQAPRAVALVPRHTTPSVASGASVMGAGPATAGFPSWSAAQNDAVTYPVTSRMGVARGQPLPAMPPLLVNPYAPWLEDQ
jgi:hypothetical protein